MALTLVAVVDGVTPPRPPPRSTATTAFPPLRLVNMESVSDHDQVGPGV